MHWSPFISKLNGVQRIICVLGALASLGIFIAAIVSLFIKFTFLGILYILLSIIPFLLWYFLSLGFSTRPDEVAKSQPGWGWVLLLYLFYTPEATESYRALGTIGSALQILGPLCAIPLYFLIRQRLLFGRINSPWLLSLVSGLTSYALVYPLILLVAQYSINHTESKIVEALRTRKVEQANYAKEFTQNSNAFWSSYKFDPTTDEELRKNIVLVTDGIRLYHERDSILHGLYSEIKNKLRVIDGVKAHKAFAFIDKADSKFNELAEVQATMLAYLQRYNNGIANGELDAKSYLDSFYVAYHWSETVQKQLMSVQAESAQLDSP